MSWFDLNLAYILRASMLELEVFKGFFETQQRASCRLLGLPGSTCCVCNKLKVTFRWW